MCLEKKLGAAEDKDLLPTPSKRNTLQTILQHIYLVIIVNVYFFIFEIIVFAIIKVQDTEASILYILNI